MIATATGIDIERARTDRALLVRALEDAGADVGNGRSFRCPYHDDRNPSAGIHENNGTFRFKCFACDAAGDVFDVVQRAHGGTFADAKNTIAGWLGVPVKSSDNGKATTNGRATKTTKKPHVYPSAKNAADSFASWKRGTVETIYRWTDDWHRARIKLPDGKTFCEITRDADGWVLRGPSKPHALYRANELPSEGIIFVCEGERACDIGWSIGLPCVTSGSSDSARSADWSVLRGRDVIVLPDADEPGRKHAKHVAKILHQLDPPARVRIVELPGLPEHGDIVDYVKTAHETEDVADTVEGLAAKSPFIEADNAKCAAPTRNAPARVVKETSDRPTIHIDADEFRVVDETINALRDDTEIFQRGGVLVRVVRDSQPTDGVERGTDAPTIQALPQANLRERITRVAAFTKCNFKGEIVRAHPTDWQVSAIALRGEWHGIRHLSGVSDAPILRCDGSVWQTYGYDDRTGVLYEPGPTTIPQLPDQCHDDDVGQAVRTLLDVVRDFPFEAEEHRAAWLAALLTPMARFAFAGPSPLFVCDANVRGVGKTLLVQAIGRIILGRDMPVSSYTHDSDEMRKKLTAIALAGDRMILFDNLGGHFGNDTIDRALTSTRWKDRLLGKSQEIDLPLTPSWYATGNNVRVSADTVRRIVHIRLDCMHERPEERSGFAHEDLLAWIDANRGELLTAALTILSGYLMRGRTPDNLRPFGGFEGWSGVVRNAVVWAGLPDPCLTRDRLAESADTTADVLVQLLDAWKQYDPSSRGLVVSSMLRALYPPGQPVSPGDDASAPMREAIETLVNCPPGKTPTPRQVGNRLRHFRRRVVGGKFLDTADEKTKHGAIWRLCGVES